MPLADFLKEARRIVDSANDQGIMLRVMGATAFRIHCPRFTALHEAMGRKLSDIDFMAYSEQRDNVIDLFEKMGYAVSRDRLRLMRYYGRYIFDDPENSRYADVFFDKLEMCHTIDFRNRLEIDYPTISLTDLLLEKLQIVKINEKDIIDVIVLLMEHKVGAEERETINSNYISNILSRDWGFYYTVTLNLEKIKEVLQSYATLTDVDKSDVEKKISLLKERIEEAPKSMGWRMRAKIGPKKKWYKQVEDIKH